MSNTEERRFLLNVFNFVFTSHNEELPSIFTETFPNVTYSEDTHLTNALRQGIMDVIETQNIASTRATSEAAADYWLRLIMNSYNEENLLNFICFHARNCLFGHLDAAALIDEFELVMHVLTDAKLSKKFTKESWEKLDAAAVVCSTDAEERREAEFTRMHPESRPRSSSSPEKPYEPVAKKPRTDLPSTSSSLEMLEAGPSSVDLEKPDSSQETDGKTKYEAQKSVKSEEKDVKSELKIEESGKLQGDDDDESDTKKFKELKISKDSEEIQKSKKIVETEEGDEADSEKCKQGTLVSKEDSMETEESETVNVIIPKAEECETTQTLEEPERMDVSKDESTVEKIKASEMIHESKDESTVEKIKVSEMIHESNDESTLEKIEELEMIHESNDESTLEKIEELEMMHESKDETTVEKIEEPAIVEKTADSGESEKEDTTT